MKIILICLVALAVFGAVRSGSTPIYKHGSRHARSPQFNLGGLLGGCSGKCNSQGYSVGRSLALAGVAVGGLGLLTNNQQLQKVGGTAVAGGVGLKTFSKLFGK